MVNVVRAGVGFASIENISEHDPDILTKAAQQKHSETIAHLQTTTEQYRKEIVASKKDETAIAKFNTKLDRQLHQVQAVLRQYSPGTPVRVVTPTTANVFYGVVAGIDQKIRPGSPAAPNSWKMRILVADSAKQITLPLSKLNTGRSNAAVISIQAQDWFGNDVYALFDKRQEEGRIDRQIFTGNIIKAFEKYPKGKLVNYTDTQGEIRQGLIMPKEFDIQESLREEPIAFKEPYQIKAFITDLTDRKGVVKTLDELLVVRSQFNGEGFLLQAPRAKESGGKYYLDEALLEAIGSDFYSVSDRMEGVISPERLEQTLNVIMQQRGYTLAAFDFKDIARDYLGIALPKLEVIDLGGLEQQAGKALFEPIPVAPSNTPRSIALPKEQKGIVEKRVARFLEEAGLLQAVMDGEDFHLKIENEPWIPLVIERHGDDLFLTHYLSQNGDTFIDAEMVFRIEANGQLQFQETAVQDPFRGGELRSPDRLFARLFSGNILEQGFAEAARSLLQAQASVQLHPDLTTPVEAIAQVPQVVQQPNFKELADQVRPTDLAIVATHLGLEQDHCDPHKWRDAGHIISIDGSKFMDWAADRGGGGAIDLVMHVQRVEFKEAVRWLSGQDLTAQPLSAQPLRVKDRDLRSLALPAPNDRRWTAVREYLVELRKLPDGLVDRLYEKGLIYADDFQNAVFVRHALREEGWLRGEVTGASLRGTWGENNVYHGLASGSHKDNGWFWIGAGKGYVKRVLLVESAIDALSLAVLDRKRTETQGVTLYLSTDGSGTVPVGALRQVIEQGGRVAVAFDGDSAGEEIAWRVAQQVIGVYRMVPAYGKDWNDRLLQDGHLDRLPSVENQRQSDLLWKWYRSAQRLGKSPGYLKRITEVAREAIQDGTLSANTQMAMQKDLKELIERQHLAQERDRRSLNRQQPDRLSQLDL